MNVVWNGLLMDLKKMLIHIYVFVHTPVHIQILVILTLIRLKIIEFHLIMYI